MSNDYESLIAGLTLQLQDVQELRHFDEGQEDADQALALTAYHDELEQNVVSLRDHRVAHSLDDVPQAADMPQHDDISQQDAIVQQDAMPEHNALPTAAAARIPIADVPDISHQPVHHATNNQKTADQPNLQPLQQPQEPTTVSEDSPKKESEELHPLMAHRVASFQWPVLCRICEHEVSSKDSVLLNCQHRYCDECIGLLFIAAMKHESVFPPRCCGVQIPLALVQHLLPANFDEEAFNMRQLELETPNRTYCSNNVCSAFIDPWYYVHDSAACPRCFTYTCKVCKGSAHGTDECPQNPAVLQLLATAASEGYKRCPGCQEMIEFEFGCNHMTCLCGHDFCWICETKWKRCACPHFNEEMLNEPLEWPRQEDLWDWDQAMDLPQVPQVPQVPQMPQMPQGRQRRQRRQVPQFPQWLIELQREVQEEQGWQQETQEEQGRPERLWVQEIFRQEEQRFERTKRGKISSRIRKPGKRGKINKLIANMIASTGNNYMSRGGLVGHVAPDNELSSTCAQDVIYGNAPPVALSGDNVIEMKGGRQEHE
ncbi:MAG: hypothetical protein Q9168_004186 [Polycauliona sp. 1 TL-2023]